MNIRAYKTRILNPPKDDLVSAIFGSIKEIPENSILVVTSKVVSIWQGMCVPFEKFPDIDELIKKEADKYLERDLVPGKHLIHTIKNNLLHPSAGVDESKRKKHYILLPNDPMNAAGKIHEIIQRHYGTKTFGIMITDSHSTPLRRGMIGISIGHYGFKPLKDYREDPKLRNKGYSITIANHADGLAAAAVTVMGEANEQTPLALITGIPFVNFDYQSKPEFEEMSFEVPEDEDLYAPFLKSVPWKTEK